MRILLDTQVWLWMIARPERLSVRARQLVVGAEHQLLLSAASAWEIAIKYALGKLTLPAAPAVAVPEWMMRSGVTALPVLHSHALGVASLPPHHRDPFDRLLVAQAMLERLPILTADPQIGRYEVEVLNTE
jgi:PIN domain nuclease of toxin-antitoxin system